MNTNLVPRNIRKIRRSNNILKLIFQNSVSPDNNSNDELLEIIAKASQELQDAQNFFDSVTDPELIDHAIYRMEAAKSRYTFLIKKAKDTGIQYRS